MIRRLIKQWLCDHEKARITKRVITYKDNGPETPTATYHKEILKAKTWFYCPECKKTIVIKYL